MSIERPDLGRPDIVSDAEREQAIAALRHHTGAGLISLDDFAASVEVVLTAQTRRRARRGDVVVAGDGGTAGAE